MRRLLENGANSSFVNRIQDTAVPIAELVADPVAAVAAMHPVGAPHPQIALPRELFGPARANSAGLDLSNEQLLADLTVALQASSAQAWDAVPGMSEGPALEIRNPADHRDLVGHVIEATPAEVDHALVRAEAAAAIWGATPPAERAATLLRAADLLEAETPTLLGLIVREAGKSLPNAVAEVREAVDFLRYYAAEIRDGFSNLTHLPLGPVACISPWNFPLAIFTGQVAAALAAGNAVLAKPAEETPLIAAAAVRILHRAGVPADALQLLPGQGSVGAQLAGDARICGVVFTGSTAVARLIQRQLAARTNSDGTPVPLIAETGGQNAMIVDSSALAEQVVADVLMSAFDSAGQRCSALRLLCLQDDVADRVLTMLRGALAELAVGNPDRLCIDIGPVISATAQADIAGHVQAMRATGHTIHSVPLPEGCAHGTFAAPTLIEIDEVAELRREVFGPVLHVLRFARDGLEVLLDAINATGYGLTFGIHTRIDETVDSVVARVGAGNVYVNRNLIGAVVGVQPFGGHGLSGTGPKAGGPLYLRRLLSASPRRSALPAGPPPPAAIAWHAWLAQQGHDTADCAACLAAAPVGLELELTGPVGERNVYQTTPRGTVLCVAPDLSGALAQVSAALATGNRAILAGVTIEGLPPSLAAWIATVPAAATPPCDAVLFDGPKPALLALLQRLAAQDGPIISVHVGSPGYKLDGLVQERSISTNTAAAGGNANLMALG